MPSEFQRRNFIKQVAAGIAATSLPPLFSARSECPAATAYKYPNPGRIVIVTDPAATTGINKVNEAAVQRMFDEGIMRFTGVTSSPADALASLFPGLTTAKKIAIKPNLINSSTPTRKELVKAVIARLVQMLGGFPAGNISLYEQHSFTSNGYTVAYFGQQVKTVTDSSFPNLGYTIYCDGKNRPYSKTLHDADYLINMPVMKDHGCSMNLTMSFKNHMGTVNPGGTLGICSNKKAVLDIMADPIMVAKQRVIILDGLFAVLNGGPGGSPQAIPNTITISQDPVTTDYQGRKFINQYRRSQGWADKAGAYIEEASKAPYEIGIADPAAMNVITVILATDAGSTPEPLDWILTDPYPNPCGDEVSVMFTSRGNSRARFTLHDSSGRALSTVADGAFSAGTSGIDWRMSAYPAGVYFLVAEVGGRTATRSVIRIAH